jgi:hypothetical protein
MRLNCGEPNQKLATNRPPYSCQRLQEGQHADEKHSEKRPLSMEPELILNIGNEPCGFLQAFRMSKLPNLHGQVAIAFMTRVKASARCRPDAYLTSVFGMGISCSGRKQVPFGFAQGRLSCLSVARALEGRDFCGYPRIAWVIPCHQEGLLRHM